MVRGIRDKIHRETKHVSREELKEFFQREAAAMRQESERGARAHRRGRKPPWCWPTIWTPPMERASYEKIEGEQPFYGEIEGSADSGR